MCKGQSFNFKSQSDNSTSTWPCNSAVLCCCSLAAFGNKPSAKYRSWPLLSLSCRVCALWDIGSCSSESPFKFYSGHSACDSVGQAYMLSYTEVRLRAQASFRCLPSQRAVWSGRGNPMTWGWACVHRLVFIPWKDRWVKDWKVSLVWCYELELEVEISESTICVSIWDEPLHDHTYREKRIILSQYEAIDS